jgi:Peptidase family M23
VSSVQGAVALGVFVLGGFALTVVVPDAVVPASTTLAGMRTCVAVDGIRWTPSTPTSGTLFRVYVGGATTVSTMTVAGEPLHLLGRRDSASALAAVPIDSANGLAVQWTCRDGQIGAVRIPTRAGAYPLERLRVAPKFSAPPDSTLALRMRDEAERAAAVSRLAHETPPLWSQAFAVPRASRVTSGFGGGRTFNGTVTSRHMGTDYAGRVGAPVRAANRGVVRLVGRFYLGGNVVYIDHGGGIVSAYLHLSKHLVAEGDTVARGAVIGHVGATGRVTGPHLHFIARYGGITVDPASLFALP